jgi:hypothetical protein
MANQSFEILNYSCSTSIPFNMEDALAPPSLAPSPTPLTAAVLTCRRSHLDSASYHTLSRLFSHCFHLYPSCDKCSAPPEAKLAAVNPTGVDSGDSPQKGPPTASWSYCLTDANALAYACAPLHLYDSPAQEPCSPSLESSQSPRTSKHRSIHHSSHLRNIPASFHQCQLREEHSEIVK